MRNSGRYPLCARGDINSYAVFAEGMRNVRERARPCRVRAPDRHRHRRHDQVLLPGCSEERERWRACSTSRTRVSSFPMSTGTTSSACSPSGSGLPAYCQSTPSSSSSPTRSTSCATPNAVSRCPPTTSPCSTPTPAPAPSSAPASDAELTKAIYRRVPVLDPGSPGRPSRRRILGASDSDSNVPHGQRLPSRFHTRERLEARRLAVGGQRLPQGRPGIPAALRSEDDPSVRPPMGQLSS